MQFIQPHTSLCKQFLKRKRKDKEKLKRKDKENIGKKQ